MPYDLLEASKLLEEVVSIQSFDAVRAWDAKATREVELILARKGFIDQRITSVAGELIAVNKAHASLPFFKRMFSGSPRATELQREHQSLTVELSQLNVLEEGLKYWVDLTPADEAEAKAMLKELKLMKKELSQVKKEVRAAIRGINIEARTKNAQISNQVFFSNPKLRRAQRAGVRHSKEAALKPHEQEVADLEQQILQNEKLILWIERMRLA